MPFVEKPLRKLNTFCASTAREKEEEQFGCSTRYHISLQQHIITLLQVL